MNMIKGIILFCALAVTGVSKSENYEAIIDQQTPAQTMDIRG